MNNHQVTHTPGPWEIFGGPVGESDIVGVAETGKTICEFPYGATEGACLANATLIKAAPDLLEALQPFVARNSSDETITLVVRTADVTRARAAIARATGGAP